MRVAICIGCGCDDNHACAIAGEPCAWLALERRRGLGVCTGCISHVGRWRRGDRKLSDAAAKNVEERGRQTQARAAARGRARQ